MRENKKNQRNRRRGSSRLDKGKGLPPELSRVNLNAAGIDVGAQSHFVTVSEGKDEHPVREFDSRATGGTSTCSSLSKL